MIESCSVLSPVRVAVSVIEYRVPSSRPVSAYDVTLVVIPLLESVKQSVLLVLM